MRALLNLLILALVAVLAALAFVNAGMLTQTTVVDLVLTEVELPLGAGLLGVCGVLALLFATASAAQQLASLRERKRLQDEVLRLQALVDRAEASRIEALRRDISAEFQRVHERLGVARLPPPQS